MVTLCSLCSFVLSFSFVFLSQFKGFAEAQDYFNPTASLSTKWTNKARDNHTIIYTDGSIVQLILLRAKGAEGPAYACGFYCNGNCITHLFAVFILQVKGPHFIVGNPQVVWSANRDNSVKIDATLELTSNGDLVLKDADGTVAWSTNTSGKSVVGLNMTDLGNLVLFDKNNVTVWQSFDQPTDTLVPGQKLMAGQRLMPSVSKTNWTVDGMITLSMNSVGLSAQMETSPPQIYYQFPIVYRKARMELSYVEFVNGSLALFSNSTMSDWEIPLPRAFSAQYIKLGSDGHLRVYDFVSGWLEVADLLTDSIGDCGYPTVCGLYGICSNGLCSCPAWSGGTTYFSKVDDRQPNLGCSENVPLSCGASQYQNLLELKDVTYFTFTSDLENIDASSCKEACAKNCSCKAAIFQYKSKTTNGSCYFLTQVFSLKEWNKTNMFPNYIVHLKVQNVANEAPRPSVDNSFDNQRSNHLPVILGSSLGAFFAMMILIILVVLFVRKRDDKEAEEDYLDQVPGTATRFKYDDLKLITEDFSKKLGQGGFGSVFRGTLTDGTKVAVKSLDGFGQVKKSFLAEVETIGSIHHVNLVRLVGFCAEKSHKLLVYEYMSNGSLDGWIFRKSGESVLNWQQRKKIILDIAKGLNYLHEDCRQKIVHLDIKPQNILLDGNFNAKVADFGLSKLIDRDQSQIVTTMRGTPGYLAPEWLSAVITEKVDVYSFGVVILEIVCGRKVFDFTQDQENMLLLSLLKRKAEEERLMDIVDQSSEDMQLNGQQAANMIRIAAWCLQGDFTKRPSVSTVIKVLDGAGEIPFDLDYNFSALPSVKETWRLNPHSLHLYQGNTDCGPTTALLASVLSGPR